MSEAAPSMITCPRCGKPQPEKMLVGGLCAQCVARSVQLDFLASDQAELEEKNPLSLNVQGYEIVELIGGGGMGEVYRAVLTARAREVAMKVVAGRLTRDPETTARFEAEVAALSKLDHPNVVQVLDHGEMPNGRHFLVMEYVDGCDLRRLLRAQKLEPERAIDIFLKVCAGVQHAHERGFVHRDIKPANILIGLDGTVKVADFGLAKTLAEESFAYGFTQTRDTFGTPYYVAPEVTQRAKSADARTDVYALGVLLYELLTGAVPMGQFTPLSKRTGMDKRLDAIVASALVDDPAGRTGSVKELAEAVGKVWSHHVSLAERKVRQRRVRLLAAVLAVLAVGAAAGSWLTSHPSGAAAVHYPAATTATREKPWENSLGMKFVPAPGAAYLCSIWETRMRDFEVFFAADNAVLPDWRSGRNSPKNQMRDASRRPKVTQLREKGLLPPQGDAPTWREPGPGFQQTPDHPVCGMDMVDARLFCAWLTWKERIEGRITSGQAYRLPTDEEWSVMAELEFDLDLPPTKMDNLLDMPLLQKQGNFGGLEVADAFWPAGAKTLPEKDAYTRTAPVGSYPPNQLGLYDLAGNLAEWTDTEAPAPKNAPRKHYYLRGGSWATVVPRGMRPQSRQIESMGSAKPMNGFRVLLNLQVPEAQPRSIDPTLTPNEE
ncbi:MAG: bifunctional serine/threonine-protein kinase/formylglycine-generating enzyme family protein [Verrucomicrobiota bacterium]